MVCKRCAHARVMTKFKIRCEEDFVSGMGEDKPMVKRKASRAWRDGLATLAVTGMIGPSVEE
jgi:hypothetical protein